MKKLMIAAASAAMIVGAEAAQEADFVGSAGVVYDVTLSLKTTKGVSAKKGAKQTVNLGWNGFSTFWYQDTEMNGTNDVTDVENIHWSKDVVVPGTTVKWADLQGSKKLSGKTIPALDQNAIKKLSETEKIKLGEALAAIAPFYSAKSAGKWCDTYSFTPDGLCYRDTGSLKVQGLYVGNCCSAGTGTFLGDILSYRFGAMNSEKATKVEYVGEFIIGGFYLLDSNLRDTKYVAVADSIAAFGTPMVFAAAGQGTFGKVSVNPVGGTKYTTDTIKTLSGNVVGVLPNTDCEFCCSLPIDAVCFDVCYTLLWSDAVRYNGSTTDPISVGTAAFGTFTVKVNQKETNYYNATSVSDNVKSVAFFNGL